MTFKSGIQDGPKIRSVEQIKETSFCDYDIEDLWCRGDGHRYATQVRLNQFGRDMRESMTRDITKSVGELIDKKLTNRDSFQSLDTGQVTNSIRKKFKVKRTPSLLLNAFPAKKGHFRRNYPINQQNKSQYQKHCSLND